MKKFVKENWKYWLKSSIFTFLTVALPIFAIDLKNVDFTSLDTAGLWGAGAVVLRLALKASWYGFVALVDYIAFKFSKD